MGFIPAKRSPQPSCPVSEMDSDCSEYETTIDEPDEILRLMTENGFVIVKDVLSPEECDEVIGGVWSSFEKITADLQVPIDRNNSETWKSFEELDAMRYMYNQYGIAHANFLWSVRLNPNILKVFSLLNESSDLLASFDGISNQVPPEYSKRGWHRDCWYHVDASFLKKEDGQCHQSYQSWVTARDVLPGDFTTGFFVGSHKSFEDFGKKFNVVRKENFYKLSNKDELRFYEDMYKQIRISCKRGSLVVWDNRLVHTGIQPLKKRKEPNFRTICYLSYGPRSGASKKVLKKRVRLYRNRRATTHWSHVDLRTVPEGKSKLLRKIEEKPNLNNKQEEMLKGLVGFP